MRRVALLLTLGAITMGAAACGDDESGSASSVGDPSASTEATPRETAKQLESCLADDQTKVLVMPVEPEDKDAPDFAVTFQRGRAPEGGGEIAIYATEDEAALRLAGIEQNAERFDGVVEPHGSITVIFFRPPSDDLRTDVVECLPSE